MPFLAYGLSKEETLLWEMGKDHFEEFGSIDWGGCWFSHLVTE